MLVGETLMRASDPAAALRSLTAWPFENTLSKPHIC
jgi:hypothetical protein